MLWMLIATEKMWTTKDKRAKMVETQKVERYKHNHVDAKYRRMMQTAAVRTLGSDVMLWQTRTRMMLLCPMANGQWQWQLAA